MTTNTNGASVSTTNNTSTEGQVVQQEMAVETLQTNGEVSTQGALSATAVVTTTDTPSADEVCFNIAEDGTVIISKPAAGVSQALEANAEQKYIFNVSSDDIKSAVADGKDLVLTFDNGSTVRLENYMTEVASGEDATLNFMNGQTVTLASLFPADVEPAAGEEAQAELRDPQPLIEERAENTQAAEAVAQVEPAAGDEAAALAQIEPAAGDGGGGAGGNSGFGFNSSFRAQGVISLDDVGPIDPTALNYGIERPNDDLLFIEEEEPADLNPGLETGDSQVLEDGSVALQIEAAPESVDGVMVITITGIPNTWTVTGPGTYDPVTETWTVTTTPGAPFSGGPIISPPADSDVDLPGLVVTVNETDTVTGQTGTSTATIDVIVDAVADTPEVDGLDDSGLEGETLDIEIPVALTGEEVNVRDGVTSTNDGSETITSIVISPVDPSVDLNDYNIANVNGPITLDSNGDIVLGGRDDLVGLVITPKDPNFVGSFDLTITLNTQENPNDAEFDGGNDTNQATDTITLTWKPVANPPEVEVDPREVNPNGDIENAYVLEDGTVTLDVSGTLDPAGSGDELLSLTVTGIDLTLATFTPSNGPNGEVWVRVPGSADSNASFTINLTTPNTNYTGTFTFSPIDDSDLDLTGMSVTASAFEPATSTTATSAADDFSVFVDAVADDIDVNATGDTGREGEALDITITNVLTGEEINAGGIGQDDGSESIVNIVITAVNPAVDLNDYTFSNGTTTFDVVNGEVVITDRADLQGLTITPKDPTFVGAIDLNVTLNTRDNANDDDFDTTNNTATDSEVITLKWKPVANPPEVEVDPREVNPNGDIENGYVLEDGTVIMDVSGTLDPTGSGDEILSLTVTGIDLTLADFTASNGPNGEVWVRDPNTPDSDASYTITLTTGGTNYTGTFTFSPNDDSDLDITGMSVTASAFEPATSTTATSAPDDFDVIVDAVADTPEVDGLDDSGLEGQTLDIDIPTALTGEEVNAGGIGLDDGSESIVNIVISAVDPSVDLSDFNISNINGPVGLDANGDIVLAGRADLEGLTITPKDPQYSGSIQLNITLNTQENPNDLEFDGGNDTNQATDTITLTWTPTINPPFVKVNNGQDDAFVKEDNSIDVPVIANLAVGANAAEFLTLTVSGIDLMRLEGGEAGFGATGQNGAEWVRVDGSPDTAASYTITLPAGVNYTGTFSFTPAAQSDLDISGMSVTAQSTDPSVSPALSATSSDNFNVIVDAVADTPFVSADDNSGEEGDALAVNIDGLLGVDNFDGSETITGYQVQGVQAEMENFTFTVNGAVRTPVNGTISLSVAEVDSLVVTPKDSAFVGDLNLNAVVLTADTPNDREFDASDNTNSARDPFTLTWFDDDEPIITQPEKIVVDETNLAGAPRTTSVSDRIDVDFGDDVAGATITGNNTFNIGGATSNGNAIAVTYNAATSTYTGTAAGNTVFTLVIENDGDYTFTLRDTIDHPVAGDNSNGEHNDGLNFNFGFIATDSDGDAANGSITVRVLDDGLTANDDLNTFDASVSNTTNGNVVTGLNGGPGAADDLSQDDVNTGSPIQNYVTEVNGVAVPTTGTATVNGQYGVLEISADGSYTYTLNANAPDSTAVEFNETLDFPQLVENREISGATLNNLGVADGALNASTLVSGTVSFVSEGAGYNNTFGYYTVGIDGSLQAATVLIENINNVSPGTLTNFDVQSGESLGFFIVADGFSVNNGYNNVDFSNGSLNFVYKFGTAEERVAKISDDGADVKLVFTDGTTNAEIVINGPTFHTTERGSNNNLNFDNTVRVVSGLAEGDDNTLRIGFEDLPNLGNKDFNDVVFDIQLSSTALKDSFVYTIVDGDGDTSSANLDIHATNVRDDVPTDLKTTKLVVDETDIDNQNPVGSDSASGQVTANFGIDAPGTFLVGNASNITFAGAKNGTLTSNGVPVQITVEGNSYVGKANGTTVFDLEINSNGQYTFTLVGQLDHANANNPNDAIALNFEVIARDADGDTATGSIRVDVLDDGPVAHDDYVAFNEADGGVDGNVITGQSNTNTNGADSLSEDANNTVTVVDGVVIAATGTTSVAGQYGTLEIAADGSYTYTLNPGAGSSTGGGSSLNPNANDVAGTSSTFTKNSITVTGSNSTNNDLTWTTTADGFGIGIRGDDLKVWPAGETLNIDFKPADTVTLKISELGSNDNKGDKGLDYIITFADGTTQAGEQQFVANKIVDGHFTFTLSSSDFGGKLIDKVSINSTNAGQYKSSSFLLANVTVTHPDIDISEKFTYTLTDADGDSSQAVLEFDVTPRPNDVPTDIVTQKLWIDETDVYGDAPFGTDSATGTATADFGNDGPGTFLAGNPSNFTFSGGKNGALTSNGVPVQITVEGNGYVGKANGTTVFELNINNNGQYTFTLHEQLDHGNPNDPNDGVDMYFEVVARDADGDMASGQIRVYVQDDAPVANKDVNNFNFNVVEKDYNVVLVLDVSGSMEGNKLMLLKSSIANLLSEYNGYQNGDIKVHIVPFATSAQTSATFTVTNNSDFNNAINFVNGLRADGFTNYEAPMQSAINWLQGATNNDPIAGAETYSYFVSDGEPNRYVNNSGSVIDGSASTVMGQITGSDGTNEVALLKSLSTEVISVGIGVNSTTLGRLGTIDSDGKALDVKDPADLSAALLDSNPITGGETSGNVITGAGNDNVGGADGMSFDGSNFISFVNGTAVSANGNTIINGSHGKLSIAADGSYTYTLNPSVNDDVQERFTYTLTDADGDSSNAMLQINATMAGSVDTAGARLFTVDGYDNVIDLADHETASGTQGKDAFVFGVDSHDNVITGYNAAEGDALDISSILTGYDELTDMLEDFVFINNVANDTQVFVDASGSGNMAAATLLVTLDGVDVALTDMNFDTQSKVV